MPDGSGWANVTASNGQTYSYKYAGGSDGNGNVTVTEADQEIVVGLICDQRYHVDGVDLRDPKGDITKSYTTRQVTLTDSNADTDYDVYYSIDIQDTNANCTFKCDPEIHNRKK
jgi:hypothetical protein